MENTSLVAFAWSLHFARIYGLKIQKRPGPNVKPNMAKLAKLVTFSRVLISALAQRLK